MSQKPAQSQLSEGDSVIFTRDVTGFMLAGADQENGDEVWIQNGQTGKVEPLPDFITSGAYICVRLDYEAVGYIVSPEWVRKVEGL